MISILIPYRNREPKRLRVLFRSLANQTNNNFQVFFIDYGSSEPVRKKVRKLCNKYSFVRYYYYPTQFQPWNKSRALNAIIKNLDSEYCFIADVDIIFHQDFVETASSLANNQITTYFQVGYLCQSENNNTINFDDYKNYHLSNQEATGLSLFPVQQLKNLHGFDEFYHFWGAEDTDIHVRLKNAGCTVKFYNAKLLLLHQWHESYQRSEKSESDHGLQINGILPLNHQHLKNAIVMRHTKTNNENWGEILGEEDVSQLEAADLNLQVSNEKRQVDDILYGQLPNQKNKFFKVRFILDPFEKSWKYRMKRFFGKKVPQYYSMRDIKDLVLLHLISFYRNKAYSVKVNTIKQEIEIAIKFFD